MPEVHEIHRIGVISDTHLPARGPRIPDAALRHFEDVELIIHAGDHSTRAAIDQLAAYAPVEAVCGNVEDDEIIATLPIKRELVVGGCAIGIVHILGDRAYYLQTARREFPVARVVIFGHSHQKRRRMQPSLQGVRRNAPPPAGGAYQPIDDPPQLCYTCFHETDLARQTGAHA